MSNKNTELAQIEETNESIVSSDNTKSNQEFSTGNIAQLIEGVQQIEARKVLDINVAMIYLDVEQNKKYKMRFCGFIWENYPEIPEPLKCAVLCDESKNLYKYGAKNFTGAIERANLEAGTDIEFCWTGLKKTSTGGNMRIHSVKPILKDETAN